MSLRDVAREALDVPIGLVNPPVLPARSAMDEQKLDELSGSIARHGIIQRLILVRDGERFEVVAGHRRFLAALRAGLVVVPADVYPTKDAALEAVKHAENRFREEMSPAEEAVFFAELLERDHGGDIEALAAAIGEKVGYVDNRLQLFLGNKAVFQALMDRKINIGVAQELNRITDDSWCRFYLEHAVKGGSTRSVVSGWVAQYQRETAAHVDAPIVDAPQGTPIAAPAYDPMKCFICQKSDPRQLPEQISVHTACRLAILEGLLAAYRGEA